MLSSCSSMSFILHCDLPSTIDFFFLCAASLLILANTDIKRLFIYCDHHILCISEFWCWVFQHSHYPGRLLFVKKYIYIITAILHSVRWIFVPVCRWWKWYSQRHHALSRINQWWRAGTRTQPGHRTPNVVLFFIILWCDVFSRFKGSVLVIVRSPWIVSFKLWHL